MGSGLWGHKQSYTTEHIHVSSSLDGGGSVLRNPSASCPLNCLQLVQKLLLGPRGSQLSGFSLSSLENSLSTTSNHLTTNEQLHSPHF